MCLIIVAWKARDDLPLIVAANRDEWRDRPAEPAHWWPDHPRLLAGRDLKAGGTWMGVTRSGRFAAVTNFRDPSERRSTALSRGGLVTEYLLADVSPPEYLAGLEARSTRYNGFNLILGDGDSLYYFGSREGQPRAIEPGIHGLSNHLLDEPWPKVVQGREAMRAALVAADPTELLFDSLADSQDAPDASLPDTGVGIAWERKLAAARITGAEYGTRCSTVVLFNRDGHLSMEERTLSATGAVESVSTQGFAQHRSATTPDH